MTTETARRNGWRCPKCGDETTQDNTNQGFVRHKTNPNCDFEKGKRDPYIPPPTYRLTHKAR
jgi:ssDNA-binding Zn-finger/Zn-ribbon topoisomerase 1